MHVIVLTEEEFDSKLEASFRKVAADLLVEKGRHIPPKLDGTWLRDAAAQQYLGLCKRTLQRYRDEEIVEFAKIGSVVWYRKEDLDALLEANIRVPAQDVSG